MCKSNCDHPDLKPKDGKCSEELINRCHAHEKDHACDDRKKEKDND